MEWAVAAAALVLVAYGPLWSHTRHLVTLVHESGHALVALATGRRLNSITLHSDTSGLTVSSGRQTGPGMIATAAAGYLAPAALGLLIAALVQADRTMWALWFALAALALMLLYIRNWFGLLVVAVAGVGVAAIVWKAPERVQHAAALLAAWFMLIAAPRTALELWSHRRGRRSRTTDADVLARLTHMPAVLWVGVFLLLNLGALGLGAWWLGLQPVTF
ncbi:MAG: M50 family metallopeptidase [Actinomycetota bacterium]|nr:M50 family metallopeptidase [Actinomycetota bacterium]